MESQKTLGSQSNLEKIKTKLESSHFLFSNYITKQYDTNLYDTNIKTGQWGEKRENLEINSRIVNQY